MAKLQMFEGKNGQAHDAAQRAREIYESNDQQVRALAARAWQSFCRLEGKEMEDARRTTEPYERTVCLSRARVERGLRMSTRATAPLSQVSSDAVAGPSKCFNKRRDVLR